MVRPNCSRTFAYSTAMSSVAQLTPTASAAARVRNTVLALRAAPRSSRSAGTATPLRVTEPMLRVGSSESSGVTVTPSSAASTITTSSPATSTSSAASGAPSTAGLRPVTVSATARVPDTPSAATVVPEARSGRVSARTESGAHRSITTAAAVLGRNGPGVSRRPRHSSTTASSESP